MLAPEPVELWRKQIRVLRAAMEMCDARKAPELVAQRITERVARTAFHLTA